MNEQQPAQSGPESSAAGQPVQDSPTQPAATVSPLTLSPVRRSPHDRRVMAAWGGVLAGLGFGIALAFLMRVIELASPEGPGLSIGGSIFGVLTLGGLVLGVGLGMAFAAMIPDKPGDTPSSERPPVARQPGGQSPGSAS